jgi:hypothetical protein
MIAEGILYIRNSGPFDRPPVPTIPKAHPHR